MHITLWTLMYAEDQLTGSCLHIAVTSDRDLYYIRFVFQTQRDDKIYAEIAH